MLKWTSWRVLTLVAITGFIGQSFAQLADDDNPRDEQTDRSMALKTSEQTPNGAPPVHPAADPLTAGSIRAAELTIPDWKIEIYPRNYGRDRPPYHENISAFVRVRNATEHSLTGMNLQLRFFDGEGRLLHQEAVECHLNLAPGDLGEFQRIWYAENNEFVANDPFDMMRPTAESGKLMLKVEIETARYETTLSVLEAGHR